MLLLIGSLFADAVRQAPTQVDTPLRQLLAGSITGRPTGVIGAGVGSLESIETKKMIAEALKYADFITVRDQSSPILLTRYGLSTPVVVTADLAFGLPARPKERPPTGRLGIDLITYDPVENDAEVTEICAAIARLTEKHALTPVLCTWGDDDDKLVARLTDELNPTETVNLFGLQSVEEILDALSNIDLLNRW